MCSFAFFNVTYWGKKDKKLHVQDEASAAKGLTEGARGSLPLVPELQLFYKSELWRYW